MEMVYFPKCQTRRGQHFICHKSVVRVFYAVVNCLVLPDPRRAPKSTCSRNVIQNKIGFSCPRGAVNSPLFRNPSMSLAPCVRRSVRPNATRSPTENMRLSGGVCRCVMAWRTRWPTTGCLSQPAQLRKRKSFLTRCVEALSSRLPQENLGRSYVLKFPKKSVGQAVLHFIRIRSPQLTG